MSSSAETSPQPLLALAPMDGVTDAITRALVTRYNAGPAGVDLCASEFVRVTREPVPTKVLLRHAPELLAGGCTPSGVPVFVQLLGGDPRPMAESARRAAALGARGVDINFGCPAKTVNRHDGGATLLKYPERMRVITATMRDALPAHVPLSVKIRTGWDHAEGVEHLAQAAEAGGAAFLTVHGRTRADLYKPPADWGAIARARGAVSIPVLANGDLFSPSAVTRCAELTGCDRFMLGRGAMAHPNLFAQVRRDVRPWAVGAYDDFLHDYVAEMAQAGVADPRALGRLKNWVCLAARVEPGLIARFERIKRASDLASALSSMGDDNTGAQIPYVVLRMQGDAAGAPRMDPTPAQRAKSAPPTRDEALKEAPEVTPIEALSPQQQQQQAVQQAIQSGLAPADLSVSDQRKAAELDPAIVAPILGTKR